MSLDTPAQPATPHGTAYPLSWFQERLWLLYQKNARDLSYNLPVELMVEGALDVEALSRSLAAIVTRHQSLRTIFATNSHGEPMQLVLTDVDFSLAVVEAHGQEVAAYVKQSREHIFDLRRGPVFIAKLLHLAPQKHLLLINMHHIVADGWSIEGILLAELQACYRGFCAPDAPAAPPLAVQYSDFAQWQRKQDISAGLTYWYEQLASYEDSLELPTDFLRHAQSGQSSATFTYRYSKEFSQNLQKFAHAHGCTLFMCLLAGFGLVLGRYTGRDDICIGTTTSGRNQPEFEGLIGFFINILPLRLTIDEDISVNEYMAQVRSLALSGFDNQAVPFEQILYSLGIDRSRRPNALVPVVLRHQNFPRTNLNLELPGGAYFKPYVTDDTKATPGMFVGSEGVTGPSVAARCELELSFTGNADDLYVEVVYAADLLRADTVEMMLAHHEQILKSMFADGSSKISRLSLLRQSDVQRLGLRGNCTWNAREQSAPFVLRFDAQAMHTPDAIACRDAEGEWRFAQIASQANRLAHALISRGVESGDLVAVCLDRGAPLLSTFFAIWKAGAAYVPLDPAFPEAYIGEILQNAQPKWAVTTSAYRSKLDLPDAQCLIIDDPMQSVERLPGFPPGRELSADGLAYVMYTSGSTGTPKGVRVPHRQLINWLGGIEANWPFHTGEVIAQKTTIAFAVSAKELFAGLLNGCELVFLENATVLDPSRLVSALAEHRVTRINLVPSHLDAVLRHLRKAEVRLPALKFCITAGEPLTAEVVTAFKQLLPHTRLLNNYGCTELNDITYYDTGDFDGSQGFVPIGRPIQNSHLYVLDRKGRMVPEGVAGELYVDTASMSDGYHRQPELSAERYSTCQFANTVSGRLFNTGDVVRYLPTGDLEYIGRWDLQVKVRGFRIDVRQVEKVIGEFPGVVAKAVVGEGDRLFAYYVEQEHCNADLGALRRLLQDRLPSYMVPDAFVRMQSMPRLPNGKLNRRALTPTAGQLQRSDAYVTPNTPTERSLATIWSEVLQIPDDEIGLNSHFFEVGGHSLSATRVIARIKERLGLETGLSQLFEHPRLGALAALVDQIRHSHEVDDGATDDTRRLEYEGSRKQRVPGLLEGKVVLITGSSRGIGSATARLLASHGAKVAINYLKSEARAQRVKDIIEQDGGIAEVFQADVTDAAQVAHLVQAVRARFGQVDVLVANAAIGFKMAPFAKYDWTDFEGKFSGELKSIYYLCQAVIPEMVERRSGSIVAISSAMSKISGSGFIAHSTAKAALDSFVRGLASELGPEGIRVNTVAPGLILTDATAHLSHLRKDAAASQCPLRRNGIPRDVAGAVLFLASDLAQFITGTYLPVDGGLTML